MSALAKRAVSEGLPTQEIILARGVVLAGLTLIVLKVRGLSPWGTRRRLLLLRGALGYGALSCFFWALGHLPLGDTTTLHFTNPVFGAVLAAITLREGLRARELGLVLASLGGVILVARPGFLGGSVGGLPPLPVGVALTGAVLSAAAYVTTRHLTRTDDPVVIVFYFALVTVGGSLLFHARDPVWPSPTGWVLMIGVGMAAFAGQILLTLAFRLERAVRVMGVGYLQIAFSVGLGLIWFSEVPSGWSLAGAGVIIFSTFLLARMHPVAAPAGR